MKALAAPALLDLQRRMAAAVMVPLTRNGRVARKTATGLSMAAEAARIIRPNDRMNSLERLEVYSRSYWFRLLDSFTEDFPGVRAIVGEAAFNRLAVAYLSECPSRSFTLRDLGSELMEWLEANPKSLGSRRALAFDMAQLEWAHIVAFDGPEEPMLDPEHLLTPGAGLRFGLQPYITLLELQYPVDELRVAICDNDEGSPGASNTFGNTGSPRRAIKRIAKISKKRRFVAVHRVDGSVYYRRLGLEEFRLLRELRDGLSVGRAIPKAFAESGRAPAEIPALLERWFVAWAHFGWLTVFSKSSSNSRKKKTTRKGERLR